MSNGPVTLLLLGRVELCGLDGQPARAVLAQPSRLAFLLYLALANSRGFHRKDAVRAVFWPDADSLHARQALNRAAYFLRHELDSDLLITRGDDEIGVADGRLQCDAVLFERALERGEWEQALDIYRGDLAPGFLVAGLPEFERWLEAERARLRARAVEAAMRLAAQEEEMGRLERAELWAHRAETLAPYDERVAVRRITLLDRMGDRGAALRAFEDLERRLKKDLDVAPSPETLALVEAVRGRRESRRPVEQPENGVARPVETGVPASQPATPHRSGLRKSIVTGSALLLLLATAAALLLRPHPLALSTTNAVAITSEPGIELQPALSPDGSLLAYTAMGEGSTVVSVRSVADAPGGGGIVPAPSDSEDQARPLWTADGERLRYLATPNPGLIRGSFTRGTNRPASSWKEVGRLGGPARMVALPRVTGSSAWSRDGRRAAFAVRDSIFLYDPEARADQQTRLLAVHQGGWNPHSLAWSPDGRWIAYVNGNPFWPGGWNTSPAQVWLVATETGERIPVSDATHLNVSPAWLDADHLLFVSDMDGQREVFAAEIAGSGHAGRPVKVPGGTDAHSISLSADGRRLAVAKFTARQNVWSYPLDSPRPMSARDGHAVTSGSQVVETHDVSPDGHWLAYDTDLHGNADIYKVRLDGGTPIPVVTGPSVDFDPQWSPDGREIAFYGGKGDIYVVPAEGGAPARITNDSGLEELPIWAPDGLSLAYRGHQSGRPEAWILTRERIGRPWSAPRRLTDFGCAYQAWARDGSGLLCGWPGRDTMTLVALTGEVRWRREMSSAGLSQMGQPTVAPDGTTLYLGAVRGSQAGIWALPITGGAPQLVVAMDDPSLVVQSYPATITVTRDRLYLTVGEFESDIWVMDLVRR